MERRKRRRRRRRRRHAFISRSGTFFLLLRGEASVDLSPTLLGRNDISGTKKIPILLKVNWTFFLGGGGRKSGKNKNNLFGIMTLSALLAQYNHPCLV